MKKLELRDVYACDCCGDKVNWPTNICLNCGVMHCYDCCKTQGHVYTFEIHFSCGSRDGYYCNACDEKLLQRENFNHIHDAYVRIEKMKNEEKAWIEDFKRRQKLVESALNIHAVESIRDKFLMGGTKNEDAAKRK